MNRDANDFQARRFERTATIHIEGPVAEVFPLFGPVREKDWAHGWNPTILYPKDSLVAKHMVFQTHGGLHGSTETYTWTIVNYNPADGQIEYLVSASDRLWFITISCAAINNSTAATITYSYTGFTGEANNKNESTITKMFANDLKDWEKAINHYLKTGTRLLD